MSGWRLRLKDKEFIEENTRFFLMDDREDPCNWKEGKF
jgi:hypothetical protein